MKEVYPLVGVAKCSLCGSNLVSHKGRGHRYYRCGGYVKNPHSCTAKTVRADLLEEKIRETLFELLRKYTIGPKEEILYEKEFMLKTCDMIDELEELIFDKAAHFQYIERKESTYKNYLQDIEDFFKKTLTELHAIKEQQKEIRVRFNPHSVGKIILKANNKDLKELYKSFTRIQFNIEKKTGVLTLNFIPGNIEIVFCM